MFKNKYITQLQYVQGQIRRCKAAIAKLNPPSPSSVNISREMKSWFEALFLQNNPSVSSLIENIGNSFTGNTLDYMSKLGEYFSSVADYCRDEQKCTEELRQLQEEERILKEKLGID